MEHLYRTKCKYININGAAKITLSKRSKKPPCPGIKLLLSFIPACRLNIDSIKSPRTPKILTRAAITIH